MRNVLKQSEQSTLRQIFKRRLIWLLAAFSLVMSIIIILSYQHQTDRFNKAAVSGTLSSLVTRIKGQQQVWTENSNHLLSIVEWSGLLNLKDPLRQEKLQAFFTVQSDSMGVDGIVVTDKASRQVIFNYWTNFEHPSLDKVFTSERELWFDEQHAVLYFILKKDVQALSSIGMQIYFFKAWDSALLSQLNYPDSITYMALGKQPLLSSAGSLALQEFTPADDGYKSIEVGKIKYLQDSIQINEVRLQNDLLQPLRLTVRVKENNRLPIQLILVSAIGLVMLFSVMLFVFFGQWLRRLGARLDGLSEAVLGFHLETKSTLSDRVIQLLQQADANENDQISLLTHELTMLMKSAALRDEEQRTYLQTLELLQDAVIEFTPSGKMLRATAAWKTLTGVDDLSQCDINSCVHPEDRDDVLEQIGALTHQQKQQINFRFRIFRSGDPSSHYWVEGRFAPVMANNQVVCIRGVVRDISNSYRQERQINHMALHDALTDLPNRILLEDRMEMAISRAARSGHRVALGFIDLDHFKQVNDNFGHKVGDRMLKEVTARFNSILRGSDTLSRWGGDEFVVLCPDLASLSDALDVTHKLSMLSQKNISIDGTDFPFTFSAGFAVYPDDASNGETLLAQADRAMFYAKAQGRNNIQFFNTIAAKETGRQSFYIQSRLSNAINNDKIEAWLQPIISVKTGKAIGAEVLARWFEEDQGWIPPSVFIPMAESMGLIDRLGQSVWQQAMHAFTLLPEDHRLSINLSKRQLFSNTIVEQFCEDAARANIKPERIMLEITESIALSDVAFARERIGELDSKGFGIAVDDFGVGYSSLSQLHEIPADELKLDLSFVKRIHEKSGHSMVSAIISIAKSLHMDCVAEGVEDGQTAVLLAEMGVELLQGFHFARPMPIEDYIKWLIERDGPART